MDAHAPARPFPDTVVGDGRVQSGFQGLTIRQEAALRFMAARMSNCGDDPSQEEVMNAAALSWRAADAWIAAEKATQ